jgi:Protein of unknown function (DUF3455)
MTSDSGCRGGWCAGRHPAASAAFCLPTAAPSSPSRRRVGPRATAKDIPWLKLEATSQRGTRLTGVTTIQRLNTKGGVAEGPCERAGDFLSVPYSADYRFLKVEN